MEYMVCNFSIFYNIQICNNYTIGSSSFNPVEHVVGDKEVQYTV